MSKEKAETTETNIKISLLEAKKERLFEILQDLYNVSLKVSDPLYKRQFLARVHSLEKTRTEFVETLDKLINAYLEDDPTVKPNYSSLSSVDELYCYIKYTEQSLISQKVDKQNSDLGGHSHRLPLPNLSLVSYDGTPSKWPVFYENFKSVIHDNPRLSNAEKVQYLIGKLTGKALTVCSGIPPTADNYEIIWKALLNKYQDIRVQASLYVDQMLNFKPNQNVDSFIEQFCSAESALQRLNISNLSDYIITHLALSKLDKQLVDSFEQTHRDVEIPTFKHVTQFLNEQSKIQLLRNNSLNKTHSSYKDNGTVSRSRPTRAFVAASSSVQAPTKPTITSHCTICNVPSMHPLFKCQQFLQLNSHRRNDIVNDKRYCKNCLGFHDVKFCKSQNRCFVCQRKHHTLLHLNDVKERSEIEPATHQPSFPYSATSTAYVPASGSGGRNAAQPPAPLKDNARVQSSSIVLHSTSTHANETKINLNSSSVLIPTAVVHVYHNNTRSNIRVLIDTGSMSHFITKECCDRLNLAIKPCSSSVQGIGQTESTSLGFASFKIHSRFDGNCSYVITARVINTITDKLPNSFIETSQLSHFEELPLADGYFHTPGEIDCLIGSELIPEILGGNKVTSPRSSAVAIESTLGYLVMGRTSCATVSLFCDASLTANADKNFFCTADDSQTLTQLTERFWELEKVPDKIHMSPDDEACEQHFASTYSRDSTGRFVVQLPFKYESSELGNSFGIAKRRLLILEKKLDACPELRADYNATIKDYMHQGYLKEVEGFKPNNECFYMAHRAVYRPEKSTSRTRIVLDASAPSSSQRSLNDLLYKGPNLQSNIFDLLVNLRMFSTALTADIEKMYFQIKLITEHHSFQRILYRFDSNSDIRIFEFDRVSFGLSSSPYLAMRSVRQLASDSRELWPLASYEAEHNMYMDDYINSLDGRERAEQVYREMVAMFRAGGFNLSKWISNDSQLMNKIPLSYKNPTVINFDDNSPSNANTKIVGMQWQPTEDNFKFKINSDIPECSKRTILSVTARLYDPLGIISPVTTYMKLLVQECWSSNLDWDDPVPQSIHEKWIKFRNELPSLELLRIPRHVGICSNSHVTLLGYADASEVCYGANLYIRVSPDEHSAGVVNLLAAKSRVASLKKMPLARLELCAALLLANLFDCVRETLIKRCKIDKIFAFSDSTVTLTWIHSPPHKFHTFVANRISEINSKLPACHWTHIPGQHNPADKITRPVTPNALLNCDMWFHGPQWLCDPIAQWPTKPFHVSPYSADLVEAKPVALITNASTLSQDMTHPIGETAERVSDWMKLLRVMVYVLRFIKLLPKHSDISVADIEFSEMYVVRYVQHKHFYADFDAIKNNKSCSKRVLKLSPFIEEESQTLRVGGRLKHSDLSFGQKFPIILPAKERITQLIVDHYHIANLHTGPALLLPLLRQKFWILSARNLVRQRVHACNVCFRLAPRYTNPPMGDLPAFRVCEAKAFVNTAVDYAGPFFVTHIRHRGVKSQKAYICLFVCLTTKALHLELVSDLSSELFLAAFKRFIARRGPVAMLYSDGASTFSGSHRKLDEIYALIQSTKFENYISKHLLTQRIQFKRSPPYGPHFNGLSEINVRSVKTHLYKVVGTRILTYEELSTALVQIEGLLNSRPLCNHPASEFAALTPNHFLNVTPLKFLPSEDLTHEPDNRLTRFELISKLTHTFWRRWSQEYLTSLQQREKWNTPSEPIKLGSVVVIKDQNAHPLTWPIGVVEELFPGKDSVVRTCKVRTASGSYVRPVVRLAPLPSQ